MATIEMTAAAAIKVVMTIRLLTKLRSEDACAKL
jgi:hypothetical protein